MDVAPAAGGTNVREGLSQDASTTEGLKTEGAEGRELDTDTPLPPAAEEGAVATFGSPDLGHGWLSPPRVTVWVGMCPPSSVSHAGTKASWLGAREGSPGPDPHTWQSVREPEPWPRTEAAPKSRLGPEDV